MGNSYWSTVLSGRLKRRRALAITGGVAAGAVLAAACGGGNEGSTGSDSAGLVSKQNDTFAQAKRGGVLKDYAQAQPRSLDPLNDVVKSEHGTLRDQCLTRTVPCAISRSATTVGLSLRRDVSIDAPAPPRSCLARFAATTVSSKWLPT
jgi:hypothetical protein